MVKLQIMLASGDQGQDQGQEAPITPPIHVNYDYTGSQVGYRST